MADRTRPRKKISDEVLDELLAGQGPREGALRAPRLAGAGLEGDRRLPGVQRISHDPALGQETFDGLHRPAVVDDRRASAMRFGDAHVQALLATPLASLLLPEGFANREFREHVGLLLEPRAGTYGPARATYDHGACGGADSPRGSAHAPLPGHRPRPPGRPAAAAPTAASSDALAAVADDRAPPELDRLVRRSTTTSGACGRVVKWRLEKLCPSVKMEIAQKR